MLYIFAGPTTTCPTNPQQIVVIEFEHKIILVFFRFLQVVSDNSTHALWKRAIIFLFLIYFFTHHPQLALDYDCLAVVKSNKHNSTTVNTAKQLIHRVTATQLRSISMPASFRCLLIGKTLIMLVILLKYALLLS